MGRRPTLKHRPRQLSGVDAGGGAAVLGAAVGRHGAAGRPGGHAVCAGAARRAAPRHRGPAGRAAGDTTRDRPYQA